MVASINDDYVLLKLPQFECRDSALFFLISSRPHLLFDEIDSNVWSCIDGIATVGEICGAVPGATSRIQRMLDAGVCTLAQNDFPENRKRVLVVEPHMDDAILSIGGTMWQFRNEIDFTVATVAARSNFTSYYYLDREYFDTEKITDLRKAESDVVLRILGGRHIALSESDAPVRYHQGQWTLDWFARNRKSIGAYISHVAEDSEIESWTRSIAKLMADTSFDEVWFPLGVGSHVDHELVRNACLKFLVENRDRLAGMPVWFYQDVPYSVKFPYHTHQIIHAIEEGGGRLSPELRNIEDSMQDKLRLNAVYGSQFKIHVMADRIKAAATQCSVSGEGSFESMFRLDKLPESVMVDACYSGHKTTLSVCELIRPWLKRNKAAKKIRIVSLVGFGRWVTDVDILLAAFPNALLEVYLPDANVDEAKRCTSDRIVVRSIKGRKVSWLAFLLRLSVSFPAPLVVLTGNTRQKIFGLFRTACVLSDSVPAVSASHFVQALTLLANDHTHRPS